MTRCAAGQHGALTNARPWPGEVTGSGAPLWIAECVSCRSTLTLAEAEAVPVVPAYSCFFCGTINAGDREFCWRCERRHGGALAAGPVVIPATVPAATAGHEQRRVLRFPVGS